MSIPETYQMESIVHSDEVEKSSDTCLPLRSYSKWSPTDQGATIVWRDLCVYATGSGFGGSVNAKNLKRIINNSSGAVQPGSLMALMGSRYVFFFDM